ncbi:MAG TPA: ABC transporter ATP-binding protein [Patescibacteria group bacterium]|nr:ABC transporter ATP-binding protein [Patescibacteria group bacterium]
MKHIFRIVRFSSELWRYYLSIGIFTILLSLMTLLQPLLSGWAIDEIRKGSAASVKYVAILAFIIFLTDFFSNIFSNISGFLGDRMAFKLNKLLGERYYEQLLNLPQRFFDTELTGKIIARLERSIQQISDFANMLSNNFLQFIFSTIFALAVVAHYSVPVALMLFSLYPIYVLLTTRSSGKWLAYQAKINENKDIAAGRFAEAIGQIKVVKSFIAEVRELGFFRSRQNKIIDIERPQSVHWHTSDVKRRIVLNLIFFGVYMFIFTQGARGLFTPGQAVTLVLYAMQIRIPIFTISFLVDRTQKAVADSDDYFKIMDLTPEIADKPDAKRLKVPKGQLEFIGVNFAYESTPVIKDMNFQITPDTKIALVGESGEGKTTITNLLMRLYEPQSGQILIDGQDINDVTQESLRKNIGVVFQDPALFSGTIRENIAYANPKASDELVKAAAEAANAQEFVEKLEKGYDTEIGERGLKLSGGQKQRIAIARALLKDPPILILDEATSSLDSKSEAMVQEALQRLMKGRTTMIIAHRLSTIQHVDQIITIKNGQVDEIGTPTKLAKTDGIYAQLLKLQRGATEVSKKKLKEFEIAS